VIFRHGAIRAPRNSGGFTLLEVLLAFVVFALSFATVLEIVAGSVRSATRARTYSEAALLAQSLVDMVGVDFPLEDTLLSGEAPGGYAWELSIAPYQPRDENDRMLELAELAGTELYWVDLDLQWGDGPRSRQAHFSTVRSRLAGRVQ
jgi:general secretion pathway protein I